MSYLNEENIVSDRSGEFWCFVDCGEGLNTQAASLAILIYSMRYGIRLANYINQEKRLIGLYVTQEKQFLRIRTENYCDEKLEFTNSLPVTTKADKHLHGYGMKSIRTIVEKYRGSAVASQKNNWFELKILIPVTERGD